ncbi:MAG: serine/threonine-protein kinase [Nannocystaceae bacterium]
MLRCIGMGGMGQVYAAYDPPLDRKVALKVLHEDHQGRYHPRLVREAQALARLSHPNVVAVHDVGVHDGRLFVAMELVEGVTLREWLLRHPVRVGSGAKATARLEVVLDVLLQAGEGLAAAHRAGLVHRDFKPGNVLIGDDGRVRVVDFGLVRVEGRDGDRERERELAELASGERGAAVELLEGLDEGSLTRPGAVVGTPAYMAPEQFLGTGVGAAADQFGFCVTAWEAVFGGRAFCGRSVVGLLEAVRKGRVRKAVEVAGAGGLEVVLRKGLAFGPGLRFRGMEGLLAALREARAAGEGSAPRRSSRWLWLAALVVGGATACVALVVG